MTTQTSGRDPVEKLAEEFAERYRRGERPALTEYTQKYPELAEQIRDLFPAMVVIEQFGSVAEPPADPFSRAGGSSKQPQQLGEYCILREVGRGGMGIVYEAVQESLGRHVALKVLPFQGLLNPTHSERFRREARAAAQLHHTNIVPVFGIGEHQGIQYYAMQFIQGQGLDVILKEVRRLRDRKDFPGAGTGGPAQEVTVTIAQGLLQGQFRPGPPSGAAHNDAAGAVRRSPDSQSAPEAGVPGAALSETALHLPEQAQRQYFRSVAQVGVQVAEALAYAHKQGILHRDIKPSNLLLDTRGTIWITDFGLAKSEGSDELTSPGDILGTVRYMAPERFQGQADARSDVYSLGITLYELLTARPAFVESHRARLIEQVTQVEPPRPRKLDPHIPRDLETIVLKALAKDPGERYASAEGLAEDLRRFLADEPIRARRTLLLERAWRWCRRHPAEAILSSFVAALFLTLVIGSFVAVLLRKERNLALEALDRAQRAEETSRQAHDQASAAAHLAQARAHRWSGQVGQHFQSLAELAAAAKFGSSLELRNEAIACLTLTDLRLAKVWDGFPMQTTALAFDAQFEHYARSDGKGNLSVRRIADDREQVRLPGLGTHAYYLKFSADGQFLAAIYHQQVPPLYVWNWKRGQAVLKSGLYGGMDFSPDSRRLALGEKGSIRLYDLASGKEEKRFASSSGGHGVAFDPGGRRLAVSRQGQANVQIHDVETGTILLTLTCPAKAGVLSWSSDGEFLAATCGDDSAYVWNVRTGKQQAVLRGHEVAVTQVTFNHRGDLLASSSWDETLRLWDPMTGRLLLTREGAAGNTPLQFSADDRLLATTVSGSKIELWEVVNGASAYRTLPGPWTTEAMWRTDFSPDGRLLALATEKGLRLVDAGTSQQVAFLRVGEVRSTVFDPSGGSLITGGSRGLIRWPIQVTPDGSRPAAHQ